MIQVHALWLVAWTIIGFFAGVGYRFAQWVPGAYTYWRDRCVSCGYLWGDGQKLFGRPCRMCREARR